jgi:uncharacterized protein
MELKNDFVVDRPVSETWKILTDLELIAPCLPGAQLQEVEGDEYRGTVSVKVGPISGKYKGKASFVEQDEQNHVARLKAEGRDPRQGNASAMITAAMVPAGPDGHQTKVDLTTDLGLSGKIASFARGNLEDVSRKLLTQFAENLEAMLAEKGPEAAPETEVTAAADSATAAAVTAETEPAPAAPTERPSVRKIDSPEAQPIDLLAVGAPDSLAKKLAPVVGGIVLLLVLRWLLRRRHA